MLLVTLAFEILVSISQNEYNQIKLKKQIGNHLKRRVINASISLSSSFMNLSISPSSSFIHNFFWFYANFINASAQVRLTQARAAKTLHLFIAH